MVIKTWRVENFPSGDLARFLLKLDSTKRILQRQRRPSLGLIQQLGQRRLIKVQLKESLCHSAKNDRRAKGNR